MFHAVVRALRSQRPPADGRPFTAAELHDRILPYRHFRRELALQSNQEYELTLLRLLSGERGYLDVDERLRDVLTRELSQRAPDPARLRDVADAQCSLNTSKKHDVPESTGSGSNERSSYCRYCGGALPAGRAAHFCPHCGLNLELAHCAACGAEVEPDWRYCAVCGKAAEEVRA